MLLNVVLEPSKTLVTIPLKYDFNLENSIVVTYVIVNDSSGNKRSQKIPFFPSIFSTGWFTTLCVVSYSSKYIVPSIAFCSSLSKKNFNPYKVLSETFVYVILIGYAFPENAIELAAIFSSKAASPVT